MAFQDTLLKFKDTLNQTDTIALRIWITMGCVLLTTVSYCAQSFWHPKGTSFEPSSNWLIFLGAMAGIDVAGYFAKRVTHIGDDGTVVGQALRSPVPTLQEHEKTTITSTPNKIVTTVEPQVVATSQTAANEEPQYKTVS